MTGYNDHPFKFFFSSIAPSIANATRRYITPWTKGGNLFFNFYHSWLQVLPGTKFRQTVTPVANSQIAPSSPDSSNLKVILIAHRTRIIHSHLARQCNRDCWNIIPVREHAVMWSSTRTNYDCVVWKLVSGKRYTARGRQRLVSTPLASLFGISVIPFQT